MKDDMQRQLDKFMFQHYVLLNPELLQKVIAKGGNPNIYSSRNKATPLGCLLAYLYKGDNVQDSYYLSEANVDIVLESCKILIEAGAKLDICRKRAEPFQTRVLEYSSEINPLIKYLDEQGVDFVNFATEGESPLEYAKTPAILKFLLDKGVDANGQMENTRLLEGTSSAPRSMLMVVMRNASEIKDQKEMVNLMIDAGVDIHAQNSYGETVLHYAISGGNPEMVNFFLDKGLDPSCEDEDGTNVLDRLMDLINEISKDRRDYKELVAIKDRIFKMMNMEEINII